MRTHIDSSIVDSSLIPSPLEEWWRNAEEEMLEKIKEVPTESQKKKINGEQRINELRTNLIALRFIVLQAQQSQENVGVKYVAVERGLNYSSGSTIGKLKIQQWYSRKLRFKKHCTGTVEEEEANNKEREQKKRRMTWVNRRKL